MDSVMEFFKRANPHLFPQELLQANLEVPNNNAPASSRFRLECRGAGKSRRSPEQDEGGIPALNH